MTENAPPLRGLSCADFTPQKAKEIVSRLSPAVRRVQEARVREALRWHQKNGHSAAARFCMLMLDALRQANADGGPPATTD